MRPFEATNTPPPPLLPLGTVTPGEGGELGAGGVVSVGPPPVVPPDDGGFITVPPPEEGGAGVTVEPAPPEGGELMVLPPPDDGGAGGDIVPLPIEPPGEPPPPLPEGEPAVTSRACGRVSETVWVAFHTVRL